MVSPIDLVPDFIFGLGFLDDAMILVYILKQLYEVLDRYKIWKYTKETVPIETTNKE